MVNILIFIGLFVVIWAFMECGVRLADNLKEYQSKPKIKYPKNRYMPGYEFSWGMLSHGGFPKILRDGYWGNWTYKPIGTVIEFEFQSAPGRKFYCEVTGYKMTDNVHDMVDYVNLKIISEIEKGGKQ